MVDGATSIYTLPCGHSSTELFCLLSSKIAIGHHLSPPYTCVTAWVLGNDRRSLGTSNEPTLLGLHWKRCILRGDFVTPR